MKDFESVVWDMKRHSMKVPSERVCIELDNAHEWLENALRYFLLLDGRGMKWLPEYDEVVSWLAKNDGQGLFLYGNCGRGKSLMIRYVLPAIFLKCFNKVVNVFDAQEMNCELDKVLSKRLVSLDDIGTECVLNQYGNRRTAFAEVMDAAEKDGKLVLISTNLQECDLRQQYGDRVLERVRACTKRVMFSGDSVRN